VWEVGCLDAHVREVTGTGKLAQYQTAADLDGGNFPP